MSETPRILESPEDVLSTLKSDGKRRWLYPVTSKGRLWVRRRIVGFALIAIFVALPIVQIAGKPAVLLDVMDREFTFFGLTLYPTDTLLLMLFLLTVLTSVFLFSALLGRVWCGWACPQTVYLEFIFRPIENLIEGRPAVRRRRNEAGPSFDRTWRKGLKWSIYAVLALALAHTFVAYFVGWERLLHWMSAGPSTHFGYFALMAVTTGLIMFDFGFFREQMCTITCPYARFQSVLQDRDSMIVSYDPNRGEPRGHRTAALRKQEQAGNPIDLGDCVDCGACVRTCPTGIDIRDGLQMECIACTQCIDACDAIMTGVNKPPGLIRYTSENQIENTEGHVVRPRVIAYSVVLVVLLGSFGTALSMRTPVDVNIGRAVGAPFTMLPGGAISNRLRFRVQNRTNETVFYTVTVLEPKDATVRMVGRKQMEVKPGQTVREEAWIVAPPTDFHDGRANAVFTVNGTDGAVQKVDFVLLGPAGEAMEREEKEYGK